jgi:thioredoxin reductase
MELLKKPLPDTRRNFLQQCGFAFTALALPGQSIFYENNNPMKEEFDVIIIGGSYAGMAAGMALGRALKKVLIIDANDPCNKETPRSHNFITHDGRPPGEITALARAQVKKYPSVKLLRGLAIEAKKNDTFFDVVIESGYSFRAKKLIFASGIKDLLVDIPGVAECWGKSVLHCPYCHGYEVRNVRTGILGNGDYAFEFGALISNWTKNLNVYTNGISTLREDQTAQLAKHSIGVIEKKIEHLIHKEGFLQKIIFADGTWAEIDAIYTRPEFRQHCDMPESLGCELSTDGYIKIDTSMRSTIAGVYACGDNVTRMRTVSSAIAMGTTAGMMVNKELVMETFNEQPAR